MVFYFVKENYLYNNKCIVDNCESKLNKINEYNLESQISKLTNMVQNSCLDIVERDDRINILEKYN